MPMRQDSRPHAELRAHYDEVYDALLAGRRPRDASPLLDIGSGDGTTLALISAGTPLRAAAVDDTQTDRWHGPPESQRVRADAHRLPFGDAAFATGLLVDSFEWLRHPAAALEELGRVTRGPIIIVQSDWPALWFDSEDPDLARELVNRWSGGPAEPLRSQLRTVAEQAGLRVDELRSVTIRADSLEPGSLASDQLRVIRRWLVVDRPQVRARYFDDWRRELDRRAAAGQFEMLVRRYICVLRTPE